MDEEGVDIGKRGTKKNAERRKTQNEEKRGMKNYADDENADDENADDEKRRR